MFHKINYGQRPAAKRSKGKAFDEQLCASIVAVSGLLGGVLIKFIN